MALQALCFALDVSVFFFAFFLFFHRLISRLLGLLLPNFAMCSIVIYK